MGVRILRGLSLVALVLALGWVFTSPGWESGITAVVLLGGVISTFLASPSRGTAEGESLPPARNQADLAGSKVVPQSIVVLPFDNLSPDSGDSYFSDGLTEELITKLSRLSSLRVISGGTP